jgi:hypothetical protein
MTDALSITPEKAAFIQGAPVPPRILRLGLKFVGRGEAVVGDGMIDVFDVYSGEVFWDGQQRRIEIDETRIEPLIGMGLLHGYRLTIDVVADGEVRLERLQGLT